MTRRYLVRSVFEYGVTLSETVSRAAHPSVHRRCNRRLNAAARPATSQAGRDTKQTRAGTGIRLVMWVRTPKFLVKFKSKSRILGDGKPIPSGGGVPKGRRGSVTPMLEDGSLFSSTSTTLTPSECSSRRVIKQLRRGAGDRSARVLILICRRCQGRENFSGQCPRNFSALFLDKTRTCQEGQ